MEQPIIGYKTFLTEDEFVAWQQETKRKIFQVSPLVMEVSGGVGETGRDIEAKTTIGCFVTYAAD